MSAQPFRIPPPRPRAETAVALSVSSLPAQSHPSQAVGCTSRHVPSADTERPARYVYATSCPQTSHNLQRDAARRGTAGTPRVAVPHWNIHRAIPTRAKVRYSDVYCERAPCVRVCVQYARAVPRILSASVRGCFTNPSLAGRRVPIISSGEVVQRVELLPLGLLDKTQQLLGLFDLALDADLVLALRGAVFGHHP